MTTTVKQFTALTVMGLSLIASAFSVSNVSAASATSISIPVSSVVRTDEGVITELASKSVANNLVGRQCSVSTQAENQGSVHPGNDLIVASNGTSVTLADVERAAGVVTTANGMLTLGNNVSVSLDMGPDKVFSAGIEVTVTCDDPIEVCRDGKVVTINPEDRKDSDTNPPCPVTNIEVCRDGKVIVINEDDKKDSDTQPPCPVETLEVCRDGKIVIINKDDQKQSDTETPCPEEEITVCRDGNIIVISEDDKRESDTTPPCPVHTQEVCRNGQIVVVSDEDKKNSDTDSPCPIETVTVCRDGATITIAKQDLKASEKAGVCPKVLPNTGAGNIISGVMGLGSAGYAAASFTNSRRELSKASLR